MGWMLGLSGLLVLSVTLGDRILGLLLWLALSFSPAKAFLEPSLVLRCGIVPGCFRFELRNLELGRRALQILSGVLKPSTPFALSAFSLARPVRSPHRSPPPLSAGPHASTSAVISQAPRHRFAAPHRASGCRRCKPPSQRAAALRVGCRPDRRRGQRCRRWADRGSCGRSGASA